MPEVIDVTGNAERRSRYLAYPNLPDDPRAQERAEEAARDLLAKLKERPPQPGP